MPSAGRSAALVFYGAIALAMIALAMISLVCNRASQEDKWQKQAPIPIEAGAQALIEQCSSFCDNRERLRKLQAEEAYLVEKRDELQRDVDRMKQELLNRQDARMRTAIIANEKEAGIKWEWLKKN